MIDGRKPSGQPYGEIRTDGTRRDYAEDKPQHTRRLTQKSGVKTADHTYERDYDNQYMIYSFSHMECKINKNFGKY